MSRLLTPLLALALLSPGATRAESMIELLLHMNSVIEERCGNRLDVVWVDERGQNPPCYMAYSMSCVEFQTPHPQSCLVMMQNLPD
ncbi:hypothetical protein ABHF33_00055 [Chitinibacter sp. FCG-7]|uniref:Uncharacterized protein n=1 Tax=Chitinibacter mangrovi TaxID=3153927 RepID=A0AAU7FAJ9_9NEIS